VCVCVCVDDDLNDENNIIYYTYGGSGSIWKFNSVGLLILEMPLFRPRLAKHTHTQLSFIGFLNNNLMIIRTTKECQSLSYISNPTLKILNRCADVDNTRFLPPPSHSLKRIRHM